MEAARNKLNFIYILKFFSSIIIAIFLHWNDHFIKNLGYENLFNFKPLRFLTIRTYILVELFFVIAGLLFYIMSYNKIRNSELNFKDFIIKKISRLFPIIILSTIFMFIGNLILYFFDKPLWSCGTTSLFELFLGILGGRTALTNSTLLNGPIWYISVYLLCIIIAYYLSKKSKKYGDKVYLIPILISVVLYYNSNITTLINYSDIRGLFSFFIGIYIGKFLILYENFNIKQRILTKLISSIFLLLYFTSLYFGRVDAFYTPETFTYSLFVFTPLILFLYGFKHLNKICSLKIFKFLGNISYGIYIWNFPILLALHLLYVFDLFKYDVYNYKLFIMLFVIHINVGILSYIFIEERFKKIKFRHIDKLIDSEV